ncbi:MAG: type II secretion system F family protein [Lachnospiraceae bacterium]|nr:type II secretion system F family protein [Lachnospiraceae bacterium]
MTTSLKQRALPHLAINRHSIDGKALGKALMIAVFFSWFFYQSWWAAFPLLLVVPFFYKREKDAHFRKDQDFLKTRVSQWLKSVSVNLRAGYSIENAVREARKELQLLYGEEDPMVKALKPLMVGLDNNIPIDRLLLQLANEVPVEELKDFSEIFRIARKSSGNLTEIIDNTTGIITEKTMVGKEIQTMVAAKEMEQKIMSLMPFGIILYIQVSSPGYFDGLYHNLTGVVIMTACLAAYMASLYLSQKILRIAV